MRKSFLILPVLALAACEPAVPNSGAGVGFGDYQEYLAQREAQLQGQKTPPLLASGSGYGQNTAAPSSSTTTPTATTGPAYGAAGYGAPLNATTLSTTATVPAAATASGDGSIGSDAMAALRATAPAGSATAAPVSATPTAAMVATAAPVVSGAAGPNLAAYALSATNAPGQSVWSRGGLKLTNTTKACAKYVSPDLAQIAFLERGGPQKDPGNLDPDGDGFACGWDPRPFQAARQ